MEDSSLNSLSVARTYDRYARIYDVLYGGVLQDGRRQLACRLAAVPGEKILEIGVGSGLMLPLYPRSAEVLGVDIAPGMLRRAQSVVDGHGLRNVQLQLVDAELGGFPGGSFDHVVLPYVYSVTPHPLRLMEQAFAACRPGGSIWVLNHFSYPGTWSAWRWMERPLQAFAGRLGFRTDFPYATWVAAQEWEIVAEYKVNLFSLSRLIQIRNPERR